MILGTFFSKFFLTVFFSKTLLTFVDEMFLNYVISYCPSYGKRDRKKKLRLKKFFRCWLFWLGLVMYFFYWCAIEEEKFAHDERQLKGCKKWCRIEGQRNGERNRSKEKVRSGTIGAQFLLWRAILLVAKCVKWMWKGRRREMVLRRREKGSEQ